MYVCMHVMHNVMLRHRMLHKYICLQAGSIQIPVFCTSLLALISEQHFLMVFALGSGK